MNFIKFKLLSVQILPFFLRIKFLECSAL